MSSNAMSAKDRFQTKRGRTLGPLSDLERHLPSDWWNTLFNALYLKTDGDVVENEDNTIAEVDMLIAQAGLTPDDRILDLCCGQGRHAIELARRGFTHVTGVDRSAYLIRLARRRARAAKVSAVFREGDARKYRAVDSSFDCVIVMGNSFGYFDDADDDKSFLDNVKRALRASGTLVMDLADGAWLKDHFEPRSWEWIDQTQLVCRERTLSGDGTRLISREVVIDAEKGVIADQFYAERLYTRELIGALLESVGFRGLRFFAEPATVSMRDQDLGMLARRMVLTASAPTKLSAVRGGTAAIDKITVLLGDPRLPDPVKLDGKFNEEDINTVETLKAALGELSGYNFTYVDNHAAVLQTLRQDRPAFVLNLCDEGYNNDAEKELHVAAYLELLDIPYSGAGPGCLGLCYDKSLIRAIARDLDVCVPLETYVNTDDFAATIPAVFPALIKPAKGDSSVGITQKAVVHTPDEALAYIRELRESLPGRAVLVQEYLTGPEYSVGIVGNPGLGYTVLPVLEVDYSGLPRDLPPILAYESKWQPESPYWSKIAYHESEAPESIQRLLIDYSTRLFERVNCRDYARFDFRCNAQGEPVLLEVNPNPGWCWDGKLNFMASYCGMSYADLLRRIIEAAHTRIQFDRNYSTGGMRLRHSA